MNQTAMDVFVFASVVVVVVVNGDGGGGDGGGGGSPLTNIYFTKLYNKTLCPRYPEISFR